MAGNVLLDTSAILDLFAGVAAVERLLAAAEEAFVPCVAIGELLYGAQISSREEANRATIERFVAASAVLACDAGTARHYAQVKAGLKALGRPIPENDVWIAALARQYALTLVARDVHFRIVQGIALTEW